MVGERQTMTASLGALCMATALVGQAAPEDVLMPMRDGVALRTKVWKPGDGAYPVVLTRGYSQGGLGNYADRFGEAGYALVSQQCRGNGGSDGTRFFPDDKDGFDCVQWIAAQDWCDGNVAMWGGSYWGATQWRAAVAQPPNLKAIVPGFISADMWMSGYRKNGAMHLKMTTQTERGIPGGRDYTLDEWKRMLSFLPLIDMDREHLGREDVLWNDYVSHSSYDEYWRAIGVRGGGFDRIRIPVYLMSGLQDYYPTSAFADWAELREVGATEEIRIRVGDHGHSGAPDITETIRWLDYVMLGKDDGISREPSVKIQVRGEGWRMEDAWPLPGTAFTELYFSESGELLEEPPGDEAPTTYTYDPRDPCPTLGANGSHFEIPGLIEIGPVDQRPNETRDDVLVYTTPALAEDATLIGPVEVTLHAASTARDTDFCVKLMHVQPDGAALNVSEGIVRARFRKSIWDEPELIEPGEIYEYAIEMSPVAIVVRKGHRIRVHISSSNWPLWDRNQNTGNPLGMDAEVVVAEQTVYHDAERPSRIVLPLVTSGDGG